MHAIPDPMIIDRLLEADAGSAPTDAVDNEAWMDFAACRNIRGDVFFPSDGAGVEIAKRACSACGVREACLMYALRNRIEHGVWGGTSERGRVRILRAVRSGAAGAVRPDHATSGAGDPS